MSIYRGWKAQDAYTPKRHDAGAEAPPTHLRMAQPVLELLPRTSAWMSTLPQWARPHALASRHARIANTLAATWDSAEECRLYFEDLLIDRRGGRRGFAADVMADLLRLRSFHADLYPVFSARW